MRISRARKQGRRLPKESKTIPLKGNKVRGNGEDFGKYYRCWNCDFVCNVERDSLGDSQSRGGDNHERYHIPTYGLQDQDTNLSRYSVLGGDINNFHVALENGSDGNPKEIHGHDYESVITGGCPCCGSMNWRGDYP